MSLVFEKLNQIVAAGQQIRQDIAGDFIRIAESEWPVTLELIKMGRVVGKMANMQAGDYVRDVGFDGYILTNGSQGQTVVVQVCGGGVGSDRVLGEVSVINGEVQRVKGNQCFCAGNYLTPVAGQYPSIQLLNPAGSGKRVIVSKINVYTISPGGLEYAIAYYDPPLANIGAGPSKLSGGPNSSAQLRGNTTPSSIGSSFLSFSIDAPYKTIEVPFSEPIVLEPGKGATVKTWAVNVHLSATFQWTEEGI